MLTDSELIEQALALVPAPSAVVQNKCEVLLRYPFLIQLGGPVTLYTEWLFTFNRKLQGCGGWEWRPECIKVHDDYEKDKGFQSINEFASMVLS
jgi:hypothetical protein